MCDRKRVTSTCRQFDRLETYTENGKALASYSLDLDGEQGPGRYLPPSAPFKSLVLDGQKEGLPKSESI